MSLEKVPVAINLTEGIDTKTDEKLSLRPSLMENCTHQGKGTPRKRNGINSRVKTIEGGGVISDGKYAFGYEDQSLIATNNAVYTFLESDQVWRKLADVSLSSLKSKFINSISETDIINLGLAKDDKYSYVCKPGQLLSNIEVYDISSNILIRTDTVAKHAKIFKFGDEVCTVSQAGANNLDFKNHTTDTPASSGFVTDCTSKFDVTSDGSHAFIIYNRVADARVTKITNIGGGVSSISIAIGALTMDIDSNPTIDFSSSLHCTLTIDSGGTRKCRYARLNTLLATEQSLVDNFDFAIPTADYTSASKFYNGELFFFYNGRNQDFAGCVKLDTTTLLSQETANSDGVQIVSKPFVYGDTVFCVAQQNLPENINWLILDSSFNPQAMVNNFDTSTYSDSTVFSLNQIAEDFTIPYIDDEKFLKLSSVDFSFEDAGDFVEFGKNTFIPGSLPLRYNGINLVESQFLSRPEILTIVGVGGTIPAGTYDFKAVYEYTEPNGNIVRSEPSESFQFASGGAFGASISVRTLKISLVEDIDIEIVLYRKLNSETVFKKVDNAKVLNNRIVDAVTYLDSDTNTDGELALYTTGSLLPNQAMPAILSYGFSNNRLFGVRSEDTNEILFSQKYVIGEGVFFNNFNTLNVEDNQNRRADELVASASMDNKLIVFKNNTILAIFGDGPDASGLNGEFSEPELITTDVGCINPRSIVSTGQGLLFQSQKGIYVLTRKLTTEYIGAPVEAFNGLTITGAILMEDINQVRWTTSDGKAMVYDYYYNQWSVFSNFESLACFIHKGRMAILKTDGSFLLEHDGFSDDTLFVKQKFGTGWLKISGPQEYQRIYRMLILGEYRSDHKVKVGIFYDYHDYPDREIELTPDASGYEVGTRPDNSDIESGGNDGTYQYNIHFRKQKCQAIRIEIEDLSTGVAGESYQLTDLTFIAGKKRGAFKTREGVSY